MKVYNGQNQRELVRLCYDKYNVRNYIKEKIGDEHIPRLYGIFSSVDEINFQKLPSKYAIKITQSNGYNILVNERNEKSQEAIKTQLNEWLNTTNDLKKMVDIYKEESYYYDGRARIICEELLEDKEGNFPADIRIFCFNGEPKYISYDLDSVDDAGNKKRDYFKNTYTIDWEFLDVDFGRPRNTNVVIEKPSGLDKMIALARKLSEDFIFVRVDFYNLDGRIVVGELTWIPMGGGIIINPKEFDLQLGNELKLPNIKLDFKTFKNSLMNY